MVHNLRAVTLLKLLHNKRALALRKLLAQAQILKILKSPIYADLCREYTGLLTFQIFFQRRAAFLKMSPEKRKAYLKASISFPFFFFATQGVPQGRNVLKSTLCILFSTVPHIHIDMKERP